MRTPFFLVSYAICMLVLHSCSNGTLTEGKAAEILQVRYPKNRTSNIQISNRGLSPFVSQELKFMESRGLATYTFIPPGTPGYGCYGQLTQNGAKYLDRVISNEFVSMVIAKIGFDKITGIREIPQQNAAEIDYTETVTEITPIGEMYSDLKMGQTYSQKAVFVKYGDGWRLQQ
jgi:hypothetical protein